MFAILTSGANTTVRRLYERMLAILEAAGWPAWLSEALEDLAALLGLLRILRCSSGRSAAHSRACGTTAPSRWTGSMTHVH